MAVKIMLRRMGTIRKPYYRLIVVDKRATGKGAYIENIGCYNPLPKSTEEKVNKERALYWLKNGAKPSESAFQILKRAGIIKEFKELKKK